MAQSARPITFTSTDWIGEASDLSDGLDSSYIESKALPDSAEIFVCTLSPLSTPLVHTDHQLKVRTYLYPSTGDPQRIVLALENIDDGSVVYSGTVTAPTSTADTVLTLSEAQAAEIHDYGNLRIRGYAETAPSVYFVWDAVTNADSYVLQVGTTYGGTDIHNANVGNVLQHGVYLTGGTYYGRTTAYQGATLLAAVQESTVTI